nr:MAG TPA: transcriptional regulator [Caudoviricetes sp.]
MNIVLEALLQDFASGNYDIIISRGNNTIKLVKK